MSENNLEMHKRITFTYQEMSNNIAQYCPLIYFIDHKELIVPTL